ncbi:MAG: hypothetical protein KDD19_15450 [Phaeodactylibacter sp.]|nr:hypothetical protein [Phaeodactylibacter sp.]MCB9048215.1 hypothetical protein [Lewinellaceae bacterium]
MRITGLYILLLLTTIVRLPAQSPLPDNRRERIIRPQPEAILLDSLSILYSSFQLQETQTGRMLDTSFYVLDDNLLRLAPKALEYDSLRARYRVLPFLLGQRYFHLDTSRATRQEDGLIGIAYNPYEREDEALLDFKGLDYNGNFTRGISFGNNQDLVLNSSFNLQLAGELGEGVEILAAITDENIPLQPEGNTQQLREFDRIFIQLKKDNNRLTAGDYELQRPNSYFMNYFKKLQGATFGNITRLGEGQLSSNASIAISRGQFTRNLIPAIEGNQGPYKLRGAEGERFIIVLAGTEKIFLDGALLNRGLEEDYIIDYNRGEVTFTNKRLITKDSRITVEFEYSDQSYVRSLYAAGTTYERGKLRLDLNFFNQQDSKNSTGELGLSNEQKRILSLAGDNLSSALSPSIDTLEEFVPYRVSYQLVDTVVQCGLQDTLIRVLAFTTNEDSARYTANFSFVGPGNGQYVLDREQAANERVYRWVGYGPDCRPLGDFEPVVQLVAPRQQQMLAIGGKYDFSRNSSLTTEVSFSRNDLNRFSGLDSGDDLGMAAFTEFNRTFTLGRDSSGWQLASNLSYEFVHEHFEPLNPYRSPEFLRDWNLANIQGVGQVERAREQIGRGGLSLQKAGLGSLSYGFSGFLRDTFYTGARHQLRLRSLARNWEVDLDGSLLQSESQGQRTRFLRPRGTIARTFSGLGGLRLGAYGEQEKSSRFTDGADTLLATSFYFNRYRFFAENQSQEKYKYGVSFSQRIDYAPVSDAFETSTTATEGNVNGSWELRGQQNRMQLAGNLTYRQLEIDRPGSTDQEPGETFLGRSDLNLNLIKGVFQSATTYEIGSGQEPKVEFTYIRVNPGEGAYIWLDSLYNNDGIIQPNEMEVAPFQDLADYVRVTAVTDEFIRTDNVNLNQSLRLNPKAIWYSQEGLRRFLARLSTITTLSIKRKTQKAEGVTPYNPFQLDVADTALVAVTSNIRNVLFFNQADPTYDLQLGMTDNRNKFVQTSGFESRRNSEQYLQGRWNISRTWSARLSLKQGLRTSDSEFFNNKDYRIESLNLSPELSFLPGKNFRATLKYQYQLDENTLEQGGEAARRHDLNLEARYNRSTKSTLQLRVSYVQVKFDGNPNSPVGFAMLNGLQRGQNFLWNLSLDRQLAKNIQLSISYEGRKTGEARVVHTGRAQVAANF